MDFPPLPSVQKESHVKSMEQYQTMYRQSIDNPEAFWSKIAKEFHWSKFPEDNVLTYNFDANSGPIDVKWFADAKTNICYNVLDRIVKEHGEEKVAFYWEGNDPQDSKTVTYAQLLKDVCKFANILKSMGISTGDRVAIYMPMICELVVAMLACARLGVIHNIVFGGFSANSLADRILDAQAKVLITSDGVWRGAKLIPLKSICDEAMNICEERGHPVKTCICVRHIANSPKSCGNVADDVDSPGKRPYKSAPNSWKADRDNWWHDLMSACLDDSCPVVWMGAEDPLFMLYTSGSTGKPKGVMHTVGGYMIYTATTFKYVFDYTPSDVYWCTADIGWITGHSYVVYGPMANGATQVMFEGIPLYPDAGRCWEIVDKYSVTKFYTAPTAIRALMKVGDSYVKKYSRKSLKILGTVGEPINPEAWLWYYNVVGEGRCAVVDTYWQTETGGHVLTPLPGATVCKPGSATYPFFGIAPVLLTEDGKRIEESDTEGFLAFEKPWPGMMRTVYGNHQRFENTYFRKFNGYYTTGDGAKRDSEGRLWITGRIDDMLNVSGHLMSTAQVESALVEHPSVVEAAVVGKQHEVKGDCLYCFVTLRDGACYNEDLEKELRNCVRTKIGALATPDFIQEAPGLPKTRSGKIMRRLLRNIAEGNHDLGDTTTLADPSVIKDLFDRRPATLQ